MINVRPPGVHLFDGVPMISLVPSRTVQPARQPFSPGGTSTKATSSHFGFSSFRITRVVYLWGKDEKRSAPVEEMAMSDNKSFNPLTQSFPASTK